MTQSEQALENALVDQLVSQHYERVKVEDEASLLANLKTQLEAFNGVTLTDTEFGKVMNHLTRSNAVFEKAKILRDKMALEREDGETVYLDFLDENQLERNLFQVTQQVTMEGSYKNRYDVTILVNGLPLVQIELKRRGLELIEAFNQTNRYQKHSYWAGSGLFNFIHKLGIAQQETDYLDDPQFQSLHQNATELIKLLTSIIKSSKAAN